MYIFKLFVVLLIVPLVYASLTFAQGMPQMPLYTAFDEFDVMSLYEPYELDNDYEEFQVMGVGDTQLGLGSNWQEGSMGLNLGGNWQQGGMTMGGESTEWQPQLGKAQQQPVTLGMIYQQLNPITQPEQQEERVEKYYVDENIVRPRVVQGQPVVIPRYQKQPITRIQKFIQPVVRRVVRQKVIRPHILERTEVRPQILEQPVIVPRYYDQQKTHQQFREEQVEGAPIRLQPTYQSEKVRGTPVYGTLPARYQQPMQTKQQYQAPTMTKGQFSPNF